MAKLIYIGGYGHSGSTLLEYLVTGCPDIVGCGEVKSAMRADASARTCSCGQPTADCPVWHFLADGFLDKSQWSHVALDARLLERVGTTYAAVVDSSKTAWRSAPMPFRLRRALGQDFQLVHIVRDPRAVCWSLLQRERRIGAQSNDMLLAIKTIVGWRSANLACDLFGRKFPDQYVRVRYEDLAAHPMEVITSLVAQILPSSRWDFDAVGTQGNRHQLYANRMRSRSLQLERIKVDDRWRNEMPLRLQRLAGLLSWPLPGRYGPF